MVNIFNRNSKHLVLVLLFIPFLAFSQEVIRISAPISPDLSGVYKPPPTYTPPAPTPKQSYRAPSGYECTSKNIMAFDAGLWFPNKKYQVDINFRYTRNFSPYWGIVFIKFGGMFDFSKVQGGVIPIMVGACGYTPSSYNCKVSGTGSLRFGGAYNTFNERFRFCYEVELDFNFNFNYFFIGLAYNNYGFIGIKAGVNFGW